jgi:hypothetical protein
MVAPMARELIFVARDGTAKELALSEVERAMPGYEPFFRKLHHCPNFQEIPPKVLRPMEAKCVMHPDRI